MARLRKSGDEQHKRNMARAEPNAVSREREDIFRAIGHPPLILDPDHRIPACDRSGGKIINIDLQQKRRGLSAVCFLGLHIMLVCLISLTAAASDANNSVLLRVGAYENHPKIFTDSDGNVAGLFPEILGYIAEKEGWRLEYVHGTWDQCLERLRNKEIDIMVDVALSEERRKLYDFTKETVLANWGVIYTTRDFALSSLLDLQDKNVAVMKESIHTTGESGIKSLAYKFDIRCNFIEVNDYTQVFELLQNKEADAGIVNSIFGSLYEDDYDVVRSPVVFNPMQLQFAFSKNSPLTEKIGGVIDRHIREMKKDPHSILHQSIEAYLYGRPRERIGKNLGESKKILLADDEKKWIRDHPVIRLGIDPEFVPFEFFAEDGKYSGIASDYVDILRERLGLNIEVVHGLSWKEAVDKIRDRQIDLLACVGKTRERTSFLNYSRPYLDFHGVIITRTDMPFITGLDSLRNMKVAVQVNTSHEGYLKDNTDIEPILYNTSQEGIRAVSDGKVDAFVGHLATCTYWIRKLNLTNLKVAAPTSQEMQKLHFAARKDWPELIKIINKGLASVTEQEKNEISQRWVYIKYENGVDIAHIRQLAMKFAVAILVIFVVFIVWNRTLKKQINERIAAESALKERTDKLAQANIRLQGLDKLKSMFIASMSHELRTPLNSIIGFTGIILGGMSGDITNEQRKQLGMVKSSASHLLELINDVIDVSKIEADKVELAIEEFDLAALVHDVYKSFETMADEHGLKITFEPSERLIVSSDKRRTRQVVMNLVSNAIKFTDKGRIDIKLAKTEALAEVSVADTGIGIRKEDIGRLFQAFSRIATDNRLTEGSGLGLYLSRKIAKLLGGDIKAASEPGKGSVFTLALPLKHRKPDNEQAQ